MKQDDLRVKRTKKALRNTLFELLEEKPLTEISVKELTERAGVARATFYLYYDNIENIMSSLVEEMYEEYKTSVDNIIDSKLDIRDTVSMLLQNLIVKSEEFRPLAILLYGEHGNTEFIDIGYQYVKQQMLKNFTASTESWKMEYGMEYMFGGIKSILSYWVKNDSDHTLEELSSLVENLTFNVDPFLSNIKRK